MITDNKLFQRTQRHLLQAIDAAGSDLMDRGYEQASVTEFLNDVLVRVVCFQHNTKVGNGPEYAPALIEHVEKVLADWRVKIITDPFAGL